MVFAVVVVAVVLSLALSCDDDDGSAGGVRVCVTDTGGCVWFGDAIID